MIQMIAKKLGHCKIFTVMTNHIYTFSLQFPLCTYDKKEQSGISQTNWKYLDKLEIEKIIVTGFFYDK